MGFVDFCKLVWANFLDVVVNRYVCFEGRAGRKEYWLFFLFNFAVSVVLGILGRGAGIFTVIDGLYSLAVLLPGLGLTWRRLHDIGKSGLCILLGLIPVVGWIIVLVYVIKPSEPVANTYGPVPYDTF
ncbi:MAG: DUF805 domain-containing protein [Oscillospiraceae bacterium]|nr:DUF805 domain-containing protein [Oscillospiraceae bacterium]